MGGEEEIAQKKEEKPAVDLAYSGNSAGQVAKGMGTIMATPALSFSGGAGLLNLNYHRMPHGFVTGGVKFDTNLGQNWTMYGRTVVAIFPTSEQMVASYYQSSNLGIAYDIVPARQSMMLRAGLDATTKFFETQQGLQEQYDTLSAGLSFGYRRLIAYGIASVIFTNPTPIDQYWTADLRPWPESAKAGVMVDLGKGNSIGAEVNATMFEEGGKLTFRMGFLPAPALLALTYRHTAPAFSTGDEIGLSGIIQLERSMSNIMLRAEQEVGGSSLNQVKESNVYDLSKGAVGEYLYSINRISAAQMIQMIHGNAVIESSNTAVVGGVPVTTVSYSVQGKSYTFTSSLNSPNSLNQSARAALGETDYRFLQAMFSTTNLQDFSNNFVNSSTDEKVYIASKLARLAQEGYNTVLENMSPFSPGKSQMATIEPQNEFANIQKALLTNKKQNDGICGNINGLAAEFLREVGVDAYSLVVDGHVIASARDEKGNASYVVNYGRIYKTPGSGMWPAVQAYSRDNGVVLLGAHVYRNNNEYIGYYKGPEGRLLDTALQTDEDILREILVRKKE